MNQEIKDEAIAVFEQYPLAKEVFITPDLQAFLREDRARIHNKDFVTVKRSDVIEEKKEDKGDKAPKDDKNSKVVKKSAEELIAFATTAETIAELDAILDAGEKRATVVAAFVARKEELTPNKDDQKSAEELIAFATTAETIAELDAILDAGEKRATVVAAFAARKLELTPKQD